MSRAPLIAAAAAEAAPVLAVLEAAGHRALIVGGAVRNALLGRPVADIDIATDARPEAVIALARAAGLKTVPTGLAHGTVTVISRGQPFEVTTFRRDVETDGRRAVIAFSDRLEDDALRRDFTMNALYARQDGQVLDPTGQGLADLAARRLRFVGDADARITEDYLRILRFFRFHAHYGAPGAADPAALAACSRHAGGLAQLSRERIGAEIRKLLDAPDPVQAVTLMAEAGVLQAALPGADAAALPALIAAEAAAGVAPEWSRRLALIEAGDPTEALRLSRPEAARHRRVAAAARALPFGIGAAGYRLGATEGRDAALIAAARGAVLPPDWPQRLAEAAASPLPISAADLAPLSGPALGQALRAAEALWIDSGFSLPAPALIDAAHLAAKDDA